MPWTPPSLAVTAPRVWRAVPARGAPLVAVRRGGVDQCSTPMQGSQGLGPVGNTAGTVPVLLSGCFCAANRSLFVTLLAARAAHMDRLGATASSFCLSSSSRNSDHTTPGWSTVLARREGRDVAGRFLAAGGGCGSLLCVVGCFASSSRGDGSNSGRPERNSRAILGGGGGRCLNDGDCLSSRLPLPITALVTLPRLL